MRSKLNPSMLGVIRILCQQWADHLIQSSMRAVRRRAKTIFACATSTPKSLKRGGSRWPFTSVIPVNHDAEYNVLVPTPRENNDTGVPPNHSNVTLAVAPAVIGGMVQVRILEPSITPSTIAVGAETTSSSESDGVKTHDTVFGFHPPVFVWHRMRTSLFNMSNRPTQHYICRVLQFR